MKLLSVTLTPEVGTDDTIEAVASVKCDVKRPWNVVGGETFQTWYKVFGDLPVGSRTPLICLHGGPGLAHDYLLPLSDLTAIASIPVIFYDQIGGGRSTHLPNKPKSFWTVDLFIDELLNVITYFGIQDSFGILGHSWGGMLGAEFDVRRRSEGLRHLILTNSLASHALWVQSIIELLEPFPQEVKDAMAAGWDDLKRLAPAMRQFHAKHGCTVKPMPKEFTDPIDGALGEGGDPTVEIAMWTGELKEWSIIDRTHLIRTPTLLINGRADIAQDFVVRPFFQGIPRVKWRTFELSSHTPMLEERETFVQEVLEFLGA
ncbi:proline iminopeptidase [Laetiporus sulphureus 93-53]|uniref:Proline iminopeptidase n=1 Tax=Laetiporus sulphureus 93-53 TaxID=1314785 RepID=A0A165CI17_9APHY|nr:proline iminopeptidase [Laetiporus sulphureus 93-53]KZT02854.1 proline iminopeptidase [Laetiporus sulphureus 93-53]